jgi:hypothetical protein
VAPATNVHQEGLYLARLRRALPPGHKYVIERFHGTLATPESQERTLNLLVESALVVLQVNTCRGTIVLDHRMQGRGIFEAPEILCKRLIDTCVVQHRRVCAIIRKSSQNTWPEDNCARLSTRKKAKIRSWGTFVS